MPVSLCVCGVSGEVFKPMSVGGYTPNAKHSTSISCDCSYLNLASSFVIKVGGGF